MSNYLWQLARRAAGVEPTIRPRTRTPFETWRTPASVPAIPSLDADVPPSLPARTAFQPPPTQQPDRIPAPEAAESKGKIHPAHLTEPVLFPVPTDANAEPAARPGEPARLNSTMTAEDKPARADHSPPLFPPTSALPLPGSATRVISSPVYPRQALPENRPSSAVPDPSPVVRVSIGRVEVRANFAAPTAVPRRAPERTPKLTLENYLRSRREGRS